MHDGPRDGDPFVQVSPGLRDEEAMWMRSRKRKSKIQGRKAVTATSRREQITHWNAVGKVACLLSRVKVPPLTTKRLPCVCIGLGYLLFGYGIEAW
jgi:hypothetical protein